MIDKLKTLLGLNDEEPARYDPAIDVLNQHADGGYYIGTEVIEKGDATPHTAHVAFSVQDHHYDRGDTVPGVLRPYDGSGTDEENVRNHIADNGEIPVDNPLGNKSPDHVLLAIGVVPGEYIEEATSSQYLAVPFWEDEEV